LRRRQALRVLLEPLGAEKFRPDRLFELREVDRRAVTLQAPEDLQSRPSRASVQSSLTRSPWVVAAPPATLIEWGRRGLAQRRGDESGAASRRKA
jgi:hypothetical protein